MKARKRSGFHAWVGFPWRAQMFHKLTKMNNMEKICLKWGYDATRVDPENAEKFVRDASCGDDCFIKAGVLDKMAAISECYAVKVAYGDYGGDALDRAFIDLAAREYPDNIVATNNWGGGQTALIFGDAETLEEIAHGIESEYRDLQQELETAALDEILADFDHYGIPDTEEAKWAVLDFFSDWGQTLPNGISFCDSALKEYVAKRMNENVAD